MSEQSNALKEEIIRIDKNIVLLEAEIAKLLKYKQLTSKHIREMESEEADV